MSVAFDDLTVEGLAAHLDRSSPLRWMEVQVESCAGKVVAVDVCGHRHVHVRVGFESTLSAHLEGFACGYVIAMIADFSIEYGRRPSRPQMQALFQRMLKTVAGIGNRGFLKVMMDYLPRVVDAASVDQPQKIVMVFGESEAVSAFIKEEEGETSQEEKDDDSMAVVEGLAFPVWSKTKIDC